MGTPAARTGWEDADSVFDYNFFYQFFNLLFSIREGGQVVDVHEGNLGTDIIPEAVEFFRIFFSINSYGTGGPSLLCPAGGGLCHLYEDGSNRRFHPGVAGGFLPVLAIRPAGHDGQGKDLDHPLRPPLGGTLSGRHWIFLFPCHAPKSPFPHGLRRGEFHASSFHGKLSGVCAPHDSSFRSHVQPSPCL